MGKSDTRGGKSWCYWCSSSSSFSSSSCCCCCCYLYLLDLRVDYSSSIICFLSAKSIAGTHGKGKWSRISRRARREMRRRREEEGGGRERQRERENNKLLLLSPTQKRKTSTKKKQQDAIPIAWSKVSFRSMRIAVLSLGFSTWRGWKKYLVLSSNVSCITSWIHSSACSNELFILAGFIRFEMCLARLQSLPRISLLFVNIYPVLLTFYYYYYCHYHKYRFLSFFLFRSSYVFVYMQLLVIVSQRLLRCSACGFVPDSSLDESSLMAPVSMVPFK